MDLYTEDVLDHYENPRNQGEISSEGVITGRDANASCGDMIQFFIRIDKSQIVKEVKWKGMGCAVTTAAASKLSEWILNKNINMIVKMSEEELTKEGVGFEVNPGRIKCLTLPAKVIKKLIDS